jgi:DNA-binding response OmpR family regulator
VGDDGEIIAMATILVIEDEPDQNKLIKLRLEARGFRVISVSKGKDGIEIARREKPQLILMDMILPDMHGLDATIKLRRTSETRAIPVIALSAVGSPDFMKACLQEGIVAYVRKPYDPRELFKTIEKYARVEGRAEKREEGERSRPAAEKSWAYQDELRRIESEFKKKVKKPTPGEFRRQQYVDESIEGTASEVKVPVEKWKSAFETDRDETSSTTRARSILIIDDDATFARTVIDHLAGHGYEVNVALDGVSGLKQAFERRPDLILLNLLLPGGGGETVLTNLRKAPETAPCAVFIMSSLLSARKLEDKARDLGAQGFIAKPVEPEDLLYIIESVVGP